MEFVAVIKRIVPFLLTFAAGLAIASIFVPLTAPSFNWSAKRSHRSHHKCDRMKSEYRNLRDENLRLKMEVEELKFKGPGPEFEVPTPPAPPAAPRPMKELKMKTVEIR